MMMHHKVKSIIFFALLWLFKPVNTHAFGIAFREEVTFQEQGNGFFSLSVDLSQSKFFITLMRCLKRNCQVLNDLLLWNVFKTTQAHLSTMHGISNIELVNNKKKPSMTIRFEFGDVGALNHAMDYICQDIHNHIKIHYFRFDRDIFVREDIHGIVNKLIFYQKYDPERIKSIELSSFFRGSTYTTIYSFPKKIKQTSNPFSELSEDGKSVRVVYRILAPSQVSDSISNRIHFQ